MNINDTDFIKRFPHFDIGKAFNVDFEPEPIAIRYVIISSIIVPEGYIVLGYKHDSDICPFATWEYTERGGFFWGHYFNSYKDAVLDMCNRANDNLARFDHDFRRSNNANS